MRRNISIFLHAARLTLTTITLAFPALPCFAGTTTLFAPGVTADSGWYDVNKKSTEARQYSDLNMCWAAVSSNMIQYWQDCYTAAGNKLPQNTPNGAGTKTYYPGHDCYELAIFESYMDNWDLSIAGQVYMGVSWYFSGEVPNTIGSSKPTTANSGGYFSQEYSSIQQLLGDNFTMNSCDGYSTWGPWAEDQSRTCLNIFSERIWDILKKGVGGVYFNTSIIGGEHTTTLWGADFNASGMVSAVYLTDSDDSMATIATSDLRRYEISSNNSNRRVYLSNTDYGNVEITGLFGLTAYPIPEPSVFGLLAGVFALTIGVSRRCRNHVRI